MHTHTDTYTYTRARTHRERERKIGEGQDADEATSSRVEGSLAGVDNSDNVAIAISKSYRKPYLDRVKKMTPLAQDAVAEPPLALILYGLKKSGLLASSSLRISSPPTNSPSTQSCG